MRGYPSIMSFSRSGWPFIFLALVSITTRGAMGNIEVAPRGSTLQKTRRLARRRPLKQDHNDIYNQFHRHLSHLPWTSSYARDIILILRGGLHDGFGDSSHEDDPEQQGYRNDILPPTGGMQDINPVEKIEKIAADLRAKRDDIAADVRAKGEAIKADLKAKQEKITDEVLRDRSPEAFGELGGHPSSYDSAVAGYDVATRRSFFIGIRRVILLVQVLELLSACVWQIVFPYGGVAGFVARGADLSSTTSGSEGLGDSDGRLGLALAAALGQSALYTTLLVFFGCDRVVLRAIRVTGWEHWGAATWALVRSLRVAGSGGKLSHVAAAAWLIGVASLCAYFGRQL